jgi:MFS transporter, DHA1 family, inner membrane transport protein
MRADHSIKLAMTLQPKSDIQRLTLHFAVINFAWALSSIFSVVFLIRVGLTATQVFLATGAIIAGRFVLRPIVLVWAPALGLRRTMILGVILYAMSCPMLAAVDGVGFALAAYLVVCALSQAFYWTCFHVFFSAFGDTDRGGSQVGFFLVLSALSALFGPAIGGVLLMRLGPWAAFGAGFVITFASILPMLRVAEPRLVRAAPEGAYAAAKNGLMIYFADGWMQVSLTVAWSIVMFHALGDRYDSFGGTLSLAGLAGAVGGMVLGRFIDKGHARRALWLNAFVLAVCLVLRSTTFGHAGAVIAVAIGTTLFSGVYVPSWITPVYNESRSSPCMLRFQFAAESGWDMGGVIASGLAAAMCYWGLPIEAAILLALPMVPVQALLLERSYALLFPAGSRAAAAAAYATAES